MHIHRKACQQCVPLFLVPVTSLTSFRSAHSIVHAVFNGITPTPSPCASLATTAWGFRQLVDRINRHIFGFEIILPDCLNSEYHSWLSKLDWHHIWLFVTSTSDCDILGLPCEAWTLLTLNKLLTPWLTCLLILLVLPPLFYICRLHLLPHLLREKVGVLSPSPRLVEARTSV